MLFTNLENLGIGMQGNWITREFKMQNLENLGIGMQGNWITREFK